MCRAHIDKWQHLAGGKDSGNAKIWAFLSMHGGKESHLQEMAWKCLSTSLLIKNDTAGQKNAHDLTFDSEPEYSVQKWL